MQKGAHLKVLGGPLLLGLVVVAMAALIPSGAQLTSAAHGPPGTLLWGYEAASGSARILEYDIGTHVNLTTCVPKASVNGRGIAQDHLDGALWYTLVVSGFAGDGFIHKTSVPPACIPEPVNPLPFIDGPGGSFQDDVAALDVDPDDQNLWAAGYAPVGGQSFLYKVRRSDGSLIQHCSVPFGDGGVGNDTLAVAKIPGLGGSGKYLLTDAGELLTTLLVVDEASCVGGVAVTPVTSVTLPVGVSGIDYEVVGGVPKLIAADGHNGSIYDLGNYPFTSVVDTMSTNPSAGLEDISLVVPPKLPSTVTPTAVSPTATPTPRGPVGGMSLDPAAGGSSGSGAWLLTEAIAGTAATAVVLGSAAWYVRRRRAA